MSKTLTLEEAAQQLGLTTEQFKVNLKTHKDFKAVRPLMGGATMHFRAQDIEELGRRLGLGSDPELKLGDSSSDPIIPLSTEDDQIEIGRDLVRGPGSSGRLSGKSSKKVKSAPGAPPPQPEALELDSSDEFIPLSDDAGSGRKSGSGKKSGSGVKKPGDSGVRLKKPSDSDAKKTAGQNAPTEEVVDVDKGSGKSKPAKTDEVFAVAPDSPKGRSSKKIKKPDDGSEFELKLDADSDSEFELTIADEGSDEADLGVIPKDATSKGGKSGVRLSSPKDSGISLEKDSDSEFELNLDSRSSQRVAGPRSSKAKKKEESDSEFELTLDDSSGEMAAAKPDAEKDIFETDFDIPALDDESASEAVVLEEGDTDLESSDFDLALDESGAVEESASEVVELEEDLEEDGGPKKRRRAADDDDESASEALAGVDEDEERSAVTPSGPARAARWGPLPALVLMPCVLIMFLVALMGYETIHGMWGFRQPTKATGPITSFVAGLFTDKSEMPKEP